MLRLIVFLGWVYLLGGCFMPLESQIPDPIGHKSSTTPSDAMSSWQQRTIYFMMIDRFSDAGKPVDMGQGEFNPQNPHCFQGGNLEGIRQRLPYIKALGFDAIWITPPIYNQWVNSKMATRGYHGYWAWDFTEVDPHFGTLKDYQTLVEAAHALDIRVIQDIVPGHTGDYFHIEHIYIITPETIQKLKTAGVSQEVLTRLSSLLQQNIIGRVEFQKKIQAILEQADYDRYQEQIEQNVSQEFIPELSWSPVDAYPPHAPRDPVLSQNNPTNPQHRAANAYEFHPAIYDYATRYQQLHYAMSDLDDINLYNPVVRDRMLQIYRYWIEKVGIDGFRVDTVTFTPEEFYDYFLHNPDPQNPGIKLYAASRGIPHFLTFGEIWFYTYDITTKDGHALSIADYVQYQGKPRLDGAIDFPLQHNIHKIFFDGEATESIVSYLMAVKPNPHSWVEFIDNHDMDRVASRTSWDNIQQALVCIYTIPGIPCITWGTEHGFTETRKNMFDAKYGVMDSDNPRMNLLRKLNQFRHDPRYNVFSKGQIEILKASSTAGILAYRIVDGEEQGWAIFNTAKVPMLYTFPDPAQQFQIVLTSHTKSSDVAQKFLMLEPKSFYILKPADHSAEEYSSMELKLLPLADRPYQKQATITYEIKKLSDSPAAPMQPAIPSHINSSTSSPHTASSISTDSGLAIPQDFQLWLLVGHDYANRIKIEHPLSQSTFTFPIADLGNGRYDLQLMAQTGEEMMVSNEVNMTVQQDYENYPSATIVRQGKEGMMNFPILPPDNWPEGVLEMQNATVATCGKNLQLQLKMNNISQQWNPANQFDHVNFHIFFRFPGQSKQAIAELPKISGCYDDFVWNAGFVLGGWSKQAFSAVNSTEKNYGDLISCRIAHQVDKTNKVITIQFPSEFFASLEQFQGLEILVTTWDADGIEGFRPLLKTSGDWNFYCPYLPENMTTSQIPRIYGHRRIRLD